jgi:3-phenylpropionate/trans-cinnamate dioxygenase ferredoxin subunit
MANFTKVGTVSDFPPGALRSCDVNGQDVAVVQVEGQFYAFANYCTHEGITLTAGYGSVRNKELVCMMHSSWFDIETGEVLSGPAPDPLEMFQVRVESNDVFVGEREG